MQVSDVLDRLISIGLAIAAVFFVSEFWLLFLVVFLGHAHFVLAYWYKFLSIGNFWRSHFFWLWIGTLVVGILVTLSVLSYIFLIVIAALLFVVHHIVDDCFLSRLAIPWTKALLIFNGLVVLFLYKSWLIVTHLPLTDVPLLLLAVATLIFSLVYISLLRPANQRFYWYAIGIATLSSVLILVANQVPMVQLLGGIVLTHYILWYIAYFRKLSGNKAALRTYSARMLAANVFFVGIGALLVLGYTIPGADYFFSEKFFYFWTSLHIVFSFIPKTFTFKFA